MIYLIRFQSGHFVHRNRRITPYQQTIETKRKIENLSQIFWTGREAFPDLTVTSNVLKTKKL